VLDPLVILNSATLQKDLSQRRFFLLNKNLVHLIDDIFWNMGFKHETQTENVVLIILIFCMIHLIFIIPTILTFFQYFQVRVDLGIANYVWQDKRAIIAQ
jgi:hypothetical protein